MNPLLTESQMMALERAACDHLEFAFPGGADVAEDMRTQAGNWIWNTLTEMAPGTPRSQTQLNIAVTTLIGGE
jgi:hypothetical protein